MFQTESMTVDYNNSGERVNVAMFRSKYSTCSEVGSYLQIFLRAHDLSITWEMTSKGQTGGEHVALRSRDGSSQLPLDRCPCRLKVAGCTLQGDLTYKTTHLPSTLP